MVIDETVIKGDSAPLMIYDNPGLRPQPQSNCLIFNHIKGFLPFMLYSQGD